jgi:tetratricopeptide (TPR) repeat protein
VGGGWWAYRALSEKTEAAATITTGRIRAQLLAAVESAYRRDVKVADQPADWQERERLRKAAEAQRAAQIARIDEVAASFAEIGRRGQAASVFKELTRILQAQGVTKALAYVETKRSAILERVRARRATARERDRAELQPALTSARLYATQGQAGIARTRYAEVLKLEPDWPAALHDNLWFLIDQGDQAVIRGNLPDAKRNYSEAQARATHLLALKPDNSEWQRDLSASLDRIGDVKSAQGDLAGALAAYEKSRQIRERLAKSDPSNAGWQRDLLVSQWKLADLAEQRQKQDEALAHWRSAYNILSGILDRGLHLAPEDLNVLKQLEAKLRPLDKPVPRGTRGRGASAGKPQQRSGLQ